MDGLQARAASGRTGGCPAKDRAWLVPFAALALVSAVVFFPLVARSRTLFFRDVTVFHYPIWKTTADLARQGEFPLWNPRVGFGQDAGGSPNYLLYYPPSWARFVLDPLWAFNLFAVAHVFFGGLAASFLFRRWFGHAVAAGWGGAVYAFSGVNAGLLGYFNVIPYILLIPLVLLALDRVFERPSPRSIAGMAVVLALLLSVAEPYFLFGLGLVVLGCCSAERFRTRDGARGRTAASRAAPLAAACLLAAALAAPMLVESSRSYSASFRKASLSLPVTLTPEDQLKYVHNPALASCFWIPNPLGLDPADLGGFRGDRFFLDRFPYLLSWFVGFCSLLLVPAAFHRSTRLLATAFCAGAFWFFLLSCGSRVPGFDLVTRSLPVLDSGRYPQKFLVFSSFFLVALTVCGLARLSESSSRPAGRFYRWMLVALPTSAVAVAGLAGADTLKGSPVSLLAAAGVAAILLSRPPNQETMPNWRTHAIGAFLAVEVACAFVPFVPTAPREMLETPSPLMETILSRDPDPSKYRVMVESLPAGTWFQSRDMGGWMSFFTLSGAPYLASAYGIHFGFDHFYDNLIEYRSYQLQRHVTSIPLPSRVMALQKSGVKYLVSFQPRAHPDLRLLGLFSTKTDIDAYLYEISGHWARAFFTTRLAALSKDGRRRTSPISSGGYTEALTDWSFETEGVDTDVPVGLVETSSRTVRISVDTPRPGLLVLRDTDSAGWTAEVDGTGAAIHVVDFCFRGVWLSAGSHRVVFRYTPRGWAMALVLSLSGLAVCAALICVRPAARSTGKSFTATGTG